MDSRLRGNDSRLMEVPSLIGQRRSIGLFGQHGQSSQRAAAPYVQPE